MQLPVDIRQAYIIEIDDDYSTHSGSDKSLGGKRPYSAETENGSCSALKFRQPFRADKKFGT
jgi:hypothetical protein